MGLPAFLFENLIGDDSLITASSEDAAHPLAHLHDGVLASVFRFTSPSGGHVEVDFGEPLDFDTVFIGNHNFDPSATVTVKAGNTANPSTVIATPAYAEHSIWAPVGSQTAQVLRVEIADSNVDATQFGELWAGTRLDFSRAQRWGSVPGFEETNLVQETNALVVWAWHLDRLQAWELDFRFTQSESAAMDALRAAVMGRRYPFVFVPDAALPMARLVRLLADNYRKQELTDAIQESGATAAVYDLQLRMRAEAVGVEIGQ